MPPYPHRMSSSELERSLYITNDPVHAILFERGEPGLSVDFMEYGETSDPAIKKILETRTAFVGVSKQLDLANDTVFVLTRNNKTLTNEVLNLSRELGYDLVKKDVENLLEKVPKVG